MKNQNLTIEQRKELGECKTPEEILALAREEGVELADEELEDIAGGDWNPVKEVLPKCPVCGSMAVSSFPVPCTGTLRCVCDNCKHVWTHTPIGDL